MREEVNKMDSNKLKCPVCGGQFGTSEEMDKHAKEAHGSEGSQEAHALTCSKCGLKTKSSQELEEHAQHHSM